MNDHTTVSAAVEYRFECGVPGCSEQAQESFELWAGSALPRPTLPEGWRVLNGLNVCPNHHIRVDDAVTGEERLSPPPGADYWIRTGEVDE